MFKKTVLPNTKRFVEKKKTRDKLDRVVELPLKFPEATFEYSMHLTEHGTPDGVVMPMNRIRIVITRREGKELLPIAHITLPTKVWSALMAELPSAIDVVESPLELAERKGPVWKKR